MRVGRPDGTAGLAVPTDREEDITIGVAVAGPEPESTGHSQLTLKSIATHMLEHRDSGALVQFDPHRLPDEGHKRRLWLHPTVDQWVNRLGETNRERRYLANVRALLKDFVTGEDFDDDELLWLLHRDLNIAWEIRVTFEPDWRIFGSFSRPGEFVLAHHKSRRLLAEEGFDKHIDRCERVIQAMFPGHDMCAGVRRTELLVEFDYD
jgi:hypothetical protein